MDRQVSSSKNSHQSGSALLVSIALLSMLALLGILIMQQARVASTTTKSHTRNAQAKITAHSGLERAFSLINQEVQIKQTPVGGAGAGFYYGRTGPGYEQNISQKNVPLREAYWTSYSQPRSGSHPLADRNQNKSIEIHGIGSNKTGSDGIDNDGDEEADESDEGGGDLRHHFGISGELPSASEDTRNVFSLRITDTSRKIYINGPDKNRSDDSSWELAENKIRLLNNIGTYLFEQNRLPFANLGNRVNRARQELSRHITSFEQLLNTDPFEHHDDLKNTLKPYLSFYNWINHSTLHPESMKHPSTDQLRLVRNNRSQSPVQPRAPINVNSASQEILFALFWKVEAFVPNPDQKTVSLTEEKYLEAPDTPPPTPSRHVQIRKGLAKKLATRFIKRRQELIQTRGYGFSGHREINRFIYALDSNKDLSQLQPESSITPIRQWGYKKPVYVQALQQALVANINPNSRLPHVNPNFAMKIRLGDVSKADLTQWTTELSVSPNGIFQVKSLGRIVEKVPHKKDVYQLKAQESTVATMIAYERRKLSTQKEFVRNRSPGIGQMELDHEHHRLISYPEHMRNLQNQSDRKKEDLAARYDGYLMLPTTDVTSNPAGFTYTQSLGSSSDKSEIKSGVSSANSGSLFPDGIFAGRARFQDDIDTSFGSKFESIIHEDLGKRFYLKHGSISLWVKPTWFGDNAPKRYPPPHAMDGTRTLFLVQDYLNSIQYDPNDPNRNQHFLSLFLKSLTAFIQYREGAPYLFGTLGTPFSYEQEPVGNPDNPEKDQNTETIIKKLDSDEVSHMPLELKHELVDPYLSRSLPANSWYYPGQWHHVVLEWKVPEEGDYAMSYDKFNPPPKEVRKRIEKIDPDFFDIRRDKAKTATVLTRVRVDGKPAPNGWQPSLQITNNYQISESKDLMVGSMSITDRLKISGFPWPFEGTIDDIRIEYDGTWEENYAQIPDRYVRRGVYTGYLEPALVGQNRYPSRYKKAIGGSYHAYLPERPGSVSTRVELSISKNKEYRIDPTPSAYWSQNSDSNSTNQNLGESHEKGYSKFPVYTTDKPIPMNIKLYAEGSWIKESPILDSASIYLHHGQPHYLRYARSE